MPNLKYKIGYIDLHDSKEDIFLSLKTRTEIRKAEKNDIRIVPYLEDRSEGVVEECIALLKELLVRELVPFSNFFPSILRDKNNILLAAYKGNKIVSFIVFSLNTKNAFFNGCKTGYLELSATDYNFKNLCPNYLLIWQAIVFLKGRNFDYFNLGLLEYDKSKDVDINRVAFFKRKWSVVERTEIEQTNFLRYVYIIFLKRFRIVKWLVYVIRQVI